MPPAPESRPADVGSHRYATLDAVRGLAALLVVLHHGWVLSGEPHVDGGPVRSVLSGGFIAVDVFFVLSGLVLFAPWAARPDRAVSYGGFVVRRFARLGPACWLVLAVSLAIRTWVTPLPALSARQLAVAIPAHLSFLHTIVVGFDDRLGFGVDDVVWTLTIEMVFSLLLPLIARWWARHPVAGLVGALVVSRAYDLFVGHEEPSYATGQAHLDGARLAAQLPTYALHFGVGMSLACWLVSPKAAEARAWVSGKADLVGFVATGLLIVGIGVFGHRELTTHDTFGRYTHTWLLTPVIAAVLAAAVLAPAATAFSRLLSARVTVLLGALSYSVYLLHVPVMRVVAKVAGGSGTSLMLLLMVVGGGLAYAAAWGLRRWVEVPGNDWGKRVAARLQRG